MSYSDIENINKNKDTTWNITQDEVDKNRYYVQHKGHFNTCIIGKENAERYLIKQKAIYKKIECEKINDRNILCECGERMTNTDMFTVDSQVKGRLDVGFICPKCNITIWTYKLEIPKE